MKKEIIISLVFASSFPVFGVTYEWDDMATLPSGMYTTPATPPFLHVFSTNPEDVILNVNFTDDAYGLLSQSAGKVNGDIYVNVTGENILTLSNIEPWRYNNSLESESRYKCFDFHFNSGKFDFAASSSTIRIISYLLGTDPDAKPDRAQHVVFGSGSVVTAQNFTAYGAISAIESTTGKPKYETQEYIDNSSFNFNGSFTTSGTFTIGSAINNDTIPVKTNVIVGSTGVLDTNDFTMRGGTFKVESGGTFSTITTGTLTGDSVATIGGDSNVTIGANFDMNMTSHLTIMATTASTPNMTVNGDFITRNTSSVDVYGHLKVAGLLTTVRGNFMAHSGSTMDVTSMNIIDGGHFRVKTGASLISVKGTFNVDNASFATLETGAFMNVNVLQSSGTGLITIDSGALLMVASSSAYTYKAANLSGSTVVKGELHIYSTTSGGSGHGATSVTGCGNMTIDGGGVSEYTPGTSMYLFNPYDGKTLSIINGGQIANTGDNYLGLQGGSVVTDSTGRIYLSKIAYHSRAGSSVSLASPEVMPSIAEILVKDSYDNKLSLGKGDSAYTVTAMKFLRGSGSNGASITLDLNGAEVIFGEISAYKAVESASWTYTLTFLDFAAGLVKVDNWDTELISTGTFVIPGCTDNRQTLTLVAYDSAGRLLDGLWSIDANGYLFNSAIPEPAEWAAIFGVLALAFAAWRKRRN